MKVAEKRLAAVANPEKLKEKQVEAMCIQLYRTVGCRVVKFSQPHKATQTLGIPDLLVYYKDSRGVRKWWHECKRRHAKPTPHQLQFHAFLREMEEIVYVGGVNKAITALAEQGVAEMESLPEHW